jgi:hypothetical protein
MASPAPHLWPTKLGLGKDIARRYKRDHQFMIPEGARLTAEYFAARSDVSVRVEVDTTGAN